MHTVGTVLCATASIAPGCKSPPTYGYHYELTQQFGGAESSESATHEATSLLASAKTVAFYPPAACLDSETGLGSKHDTLVQAECGVLLSTLERATERAGYEVLLWQNLRGQKRPIEYAREGNVDVLFEINEFDLDNVVDSQVRRTLTFYRVDRGNRTTVHVPQTVAQRCAAYSASRDPIQIAGLSGTIDIRTVSVSDGRDRWHYRKTLSQAVGRTYPQTGFNSKPRSTRPAWVFGGVGAASFIVGLTSALIAATSSDNPSTGEMKADFGSAPILLMAGGVLLGATGIALGQTQDSLGPEDILCFQPNEEAVPAAPVVVGTGPLASQASLSETTDNDPFQVEREKLRDAMVAGFVAVLTEAHRDTTQAQ